MNNIQRGSMNELKVAVDLMERGYNVFQALARSCIYDLIAEKDGKLLRVEVSQATYTKKGVLSYHQHQPDNYDIIALVIEHSDKIVYIPDPTL